MNKKNALKIVEGSSSDILADIIVELYETIEKRFVEIENRLKKVESFRSRNEVRLGNIHLDTW